MEFLDKRNVYLRVLKDGDNENEYLYSIILSQIRDDQSFRILVPNRFLKEGYKYSIECINAAFQDYGIPINHRLCVNAKKIAYEYFKTISPFGFEPNEN